MGEQGQRRVGLYNRVLTDAAEDAVEDDRNNRFYLNREVKAKKKKKVDLKVSENSDFIVNAVCLTVRCLMGFLCGEGLTCVFLPPVTSSFFFFFFFLVPEFFFFFFHFFFFLGV